MSFRISSCSLNITIPESFFLLFFSPLFQKFGTASVTKSTKLWITQHHSDNKTAQQGFSVFSKNIFQSPNHVCRIQVRLTFPSPRCSIGNEKSPFKNGKSHSTHKLKFGEMHVLSVGSTDSASLLVACALCLLYMAQVYGKASDKRRIRVFIPV